MTAAAETLHRARARPAWLKVWLERCCVAGLDQLMSALVHVRHFPSRPGVPRTTYTNPVPCGARHGSP